MKTEVSTEKISCRVFATYFDLYVNDEETPCVEQIFVRNACFGNIFKKLSYLRNIEVKINFIKIVIRILKTSLAKGTAMSDSFHGCLLSKMEIEKYLQSISETYIPFDFEVTENEEDNLFVTTIFKDKTDKEILWILNLIRHTYEFPFNAFLHEALALKGLEEFKDEHLTNLLQLVATTSDAIYYKNFGGFDEIANYRNRLIYYFDQSLGYTNRKLITIDSIQKLLKENSPVSQCYTDKCKTDSLIKFPLTRDIGESVNIPISSFAYWFDHQVEDFENFKVNAYLNNYKILKEE